MGKESLSKTLAIPAPDLPVTVNKEEIVLSIEGVSKKFCRNLKRSLFYGFKDIIKELTGWAGNREHLRKEEFWALHDISSVSYTHLTLPTICSV